MTVKQKNRSYEINSQQKSFTDQEILYPGNSYCFLVVGNEIINWSPIFNLFFCILLHSYCSHEEKSAVQSFGTEVQFFIAKVPK